MVEYLGEAIEPLRREGDWIVCRWPREKEWRHWPPQLIIAGNKLDSV